ncbi:MAG TPA: bifunctional 5,10-methylenetetrahydrofolate dehydrogenase/5,10-methenyltetrahydrofolate cyclohydrolase [Ktedonobacteraceae bacterium]|jgi:methylenetetrahydrofolate dehydrogenase (NADP+)/methenyltetrahydrofolate cyclohydrolase|nr:bifunctional 5,10-methylenetetrahydrofolate dehydrogenase/5,10-methenyltetrahydrofolate cyclohydrolase [Ktedonobacteraceae bacterium]
MSAIIFDSKPLVKRMTEELQGEAAGFRKRRGRAAQLKQIIVGHDGAAEVYSRQLARACRRIGLDCEMLAFPFEMEEQDLRSQVAALNNDLNADGVVLLLPLPSHIRQRVVTDVLSPEKDVDGLGSRNAGNLLLGFPSFIPSTADVILTVLKHEGIPTAGRNAVIVGRSNIGGKPAALVLMRNDATVTICHSHTRNLADITRSADILVVSTGRPASITADMVKPGAVVLDAGINPVEGGVVGDIDFGQVKEVASFLTPVPGGLGPLTHLMLIRHTLLGPV